MQLLNTLAENYLNGKSMNVPFRKIINLLISVSIVSFVFKKFFFNYNLIPSKDYEGIIDFFIEGHFLIPIILFALVHYGINNFASFIFSITTLQKTSKIIKRIKKCQFKKKDYKSFIKRINNNGIVQLPLKIDEALLIQYYKQAKDSIKEEDLKKLEEELSGVKINLENDFCLVFKSITACFIYYNTISYFSYWALVLVLLILAAMLVAFWYLHVFINTVPVWIRKACTEFENYIESKQVFSETTLNISRQFSNQ